MLLDWIASYDYGRNARSTIARIQTINNTEFDGSDEK